MSNAIPPPYDFELPTVPTTRLVNSHTRPQVPLSDESCNSLPNTPSTTSVANFSLLSRPDPVHLSTLAPTSRTNDAPFLRLPSTPSGYELDPGFMDYIAAHDHGRSAVVRRLPEAYQPELASLRSGYGPAESLPAYGENSPPGYTRRVESLRKEPQTLARWLFRFGFLFPFFWLFGTILIFHPMPPFTQGTPWRPDDAFVMWYNQNILTDQDKVEFMSKMKEVERKWLKRCGLALALFLCLCLAVGITIFGLINADSKTS